MQSTEEQMPAPELQRVATSTKCFQRMHIGDPLWGHSPTEGFLLEEVPGGTTGAHPTKPCRITKHLLLTQAQPAFGIYIRWCEGPESWQPNGLHSLLIATGRKHLFFWSGKQTVSSLVSASKVPTWPAGLAQWGKETLLAPPCQSAASVLFSLPVFQKTGFWWVLGREGFCGRNPPFLPNGLLYVVLGDIRPITPSAELSVSPTVKGNDGLKLNFPWTPPDAYCSLKTIFATC